MAAVVRARPVRRVLPRVRVNLQVLAVMRRRRGHAAQGERATQRRHRQCDGKQVQREPVASVRHGGRVALIPQDNQGQGGLPSVGKDEALIFTRVSRGGTRAPV